MQTAKGCTWPLLSRRAVLAWRCSAVSCGSPPMAAPFPLCTQQFEASIDGTQTAFLLTAYTDRILVVATQLGTLGTVLHAWCAQPVRSASPGPTTLLRTLALNGHVLRAVL